MARRLSNQDYPVENPEDLVICQTAPRRNLACFISVRCVICRRRQNLRGLCSHRYHLRTHSRVHHRAISRGQCMDLILRKHSRLRRFFRHFFIKPSRLVMTAAQRSRSSSTFFAGPFEVKEALFVAGKSYICRLRALGSFWLPLLPSIHQRP